MGGKVFNQALTIHEARLLKTVDAFSNFEVDISIGFDDELRVFIEDFLRNHGRMDAEVLVVLYWRGVPRKKFLMSMTM